MPKTVHMVPDPQGGWIVKTIGDAADAGHFKSRGEAENFGRDLSQELKAQFEIHHMDGTVTREGSGKGRGGRKKRLSPPG